MKRTISTRWFVPGLLALIAGALFARPAAAQESNCPPWRVGVSVGRLDFEGNLPVDDGTVVSLRLGRDVSEQWTIEGVLDLVPELEEQFRVDWVSGERISRLEEKSKPGVHDTSSARLSVDALRHFARGGRLDPYVGVGCGVIWYEENFGSQLDPAARVRAGCELNLSRNVAIQADLCGIALGDDGGFSSIASVGLLWKFGGSGAAKKPAVSVAPAPADADHDGLTDQEEREVYHTDPASADTDHDGLTDFDEVKIHHTDPTLRDTDKGGVADGHEVMEDQTDPRQGTDDLQFFELQMGFDPGSSAIRAEYLASLDAIGKILQANPGAGARIEAHVDRKSTSVERQEKRLTQERAVTVRKYFEKTFGVQEKNLKAVGYGFDRPKAANDPVLGNPQNNRIEIYIRQAKPAPGNPADK